MFEYIKGKVSELNPAVAVIETGQVGFSVNISLNTYTAIEQCVAERKDATLYIYESVREDAFTLFGFATKEERTLFLLLISVSGVGATSARMILSAYSVAELQTIISGGDVKMLKSIKGIGAKTAERIIVDLKDKMEKVDGDVGEVLSRTPINTNKEEAVEALVVLGYNRSAAVKTTEAIVKEDPSISIQKLIKESLARLR